ncbi:MULTISPECIES: hypothetical protein [unclassified Fusibacter]|uniref:hypothetical protein n=1 Tax=unclassified Fusibacter TaxID=2624464 RepID=UPI0010122C27|nr:MULTISPECIES: hypothetical protein [unclassified Fusibacter]MCK8059653.1 hypothetical protein [Fusibacter sp. A2]NPE21454.1 hypothetical protein [Fusibacter sp. A1]RXV61865.1 hypothetical protein DWB64_06405 [Fusibacter sp. A1]
MRRKLIGIFLAVVTIIVLLSHQGIDNRFGYPMYNHYVTLAAIETESVNIVTAIYLNYRYYDTLFEALMLLFSIIAVIYMSIHEGGGYHE